MSLDMRLYRWEVLTTLIVGTKLVMEQLPYPYPSPYPYPYPYPNPNPNPTAIPNLNSGPPSLRW